MRCGLRPTRLVAAPGPRDPIERTNIRYLQPLPEPVRLATVDVSFISLDLVLPRVASCRAGWRSGCAGQASPEVGKGQVGKGGVVPIPGNIGLCFMIRCRTQ
jgi:predicted rRNA methylase YqxC with S4 and FtsJ domains